MKLKQISLVTLKEETLELEHNQDKYTFFSVFKYLKFLSTAVNAELVAKPRILGILFSISIILIL